MTWLPKNKEELRIKPPFPSPAPPTLTDLVSLAASTRANGEHEPLVVSHVPGHLCCSWSCHLLANTPFAFFQQPKITKFATELQRNSAFLNKVIGGVVKSFAQLLF